MIKKHPVLIVTIFTAIYDALWILDPSPVDAEEKTVMTMISIIFVAVGFFGTTQAPKLYARYVVEYRKKYEETGKEIYKKQADNFSSPFMMTLQNALAISFLTSGLLFLLKYQTNFFNFLL